MKAELEQLVALQNVDMGIRRLQSDLESIPRRRAEIESEFDQRAFEFKALQQTGETARGTRYAFRIRDNGRGIDSTVLKDGGIAGHWGLRGARERAERIGARLDFWSEAGAGTEVQLTVAADVAYQTASDAIAPACFAS